MPFLKAAVVGAAASVSLTLLLLSTAYARAAEAAPQPFDIRPQSLAAALSEFARQSHEELLFAPEVVAQKGTRGVRGTMEPLAALKILLKDSGLSYSTTPAGAILVGSAGSTNVAGIASATTSAAGQSDDSSARSSLQLAQATPGQTEGGTSVEQPKEKTEKEKSEERRKLEQLEEVVVTGSRIPTAAGQQVVPVHSYTREDIEQSGQTTVADFLNTLPDVSTSIDESGGLTGGFPGVTTVQLHGLPTGTTLVLINGRRVEVDTFGIFDLNSIPAAAVERIEVLPVGASSIYGADTLGGAVNIITRKDFTGFEASANLGHADDLNDDSANLAWGKSWERASISLIGTYQTTGELLGSQREPTSTTSFPPNASFLLNEDCSPGNVYSLTGQDLPGISSPQAGIPTGISGTPSTQQFAATAGKLNKCNSFSRDTLIPSTRREGVLASAHYHVSEAVDLFTEVIFSHERLQAQEGDLIDVGQFGSMGTLGANNPYNPFGESVGVSFASPSLPSVADESGSLIRPLVGLRGTVFSDWHYEATAYLSHDRFQADFPSVDSAAVQAALTSSDPATALNPFTTGAPGTPQFLQSLISSELQTQYLFIDQIVDGQGVLRGPLLHLPAGPLETVVGAEYSRQTEYETSPGSVLNLARNAYAVFTEARAPLLADREGEGDRLALSLAGRYDHTSDYGGKVTWQSGLLWRPIDTLAFSGSYGVSYQAPQLVQTSIAGGQFNFDVGQFGGATDPFRGGQSVLGTTPVLYGANPELKPQTGNAYTLAIVYSSQALRGLRASLTWLDINISNYIGQQNLETLVDNPSLFPGAVIRGPATVQDQQQGFLGPITQINDLYYNFGDLHVAGFDADMSYAIDTGIGVVTPSLALANIYKWQSALAPGAPLLSYVSQAGGNPGWAPRWKGTTALNWKHGPVSANLAARYVGPYKDYQYFVPNTNELGNFWVFDLNIRLDMGWPRASGNAGASTFVAIGAVNLTDKTPPFSYNDPAYDNTQYDIRGRFIYARLGIKW
jgi:iron complex outermembrane receptor protein